MQKFCYLTLVLFLSVACSKAPNPVEYRTRSLQQGADSQAARSGGSGGGSAFNAELELNEPIEMKNLGMDANEDIDGVTLFEILSSQVSGRADGKLCSECHNNDEDMGGYSVPSDPNEPLLGFDPDEEYDGKSWSERRGWAERFIDNETKPESVKMIIQAWIDSGYAE